MTNDTFEDGDDSLTIDMVAVEEAKNEVIPKGTYNGVIENLEYTLSASSNQPMWKYTIVISQGEFKGRKLFGNLSFSPKAMSLTKTNIIAIAPELITSDFNPKRIAAEGDLIGRSVRFKTKNEDYQGEPQTKISGFVPPTNDMDSFLDD